MFCRNCGYQNPKHVRRCIECGADLQKGVDSPIQGSRKRGTTMASCLVNLISYTLIVVVILGSIAAIAAYACVIEIPQPPHSGYPKYLLNIWTRFEINQDARCFHVGYADDLSEASTKEDIQDMVVEEEVQEETMCTDPSILFEPEEGEIGTTFTIYLKDFSPNDSVEACWYYPDGTLINCANLDMDSNGSRTSKYWSESDDIPGTYSMEAIGECSSAKAVFEIFPIIESNEE